jgi:hypothetical protein
VSRESSGRLAFDRPADEWDEVDPMLGRARRYLANER